jgi:uncharacterized protein (TIGR00251 family)
VRKVTGPRGTGNNRPGPVMTAVLRLKVTPNAPANAVLGETDGVIGLKIQAPAVGGKANAALVAFLAEALRVPKAAVSLQSGRRSRLKRVEVQGLDRAEACRRLLGSAG